MLVVGMNDSLDKMRSVPTEEIEKIDRWEMVSDGPTYQYLTSRQFEYGGTALDDSDVRESLSLLGIIIISRFTTNFPIPA